MTDNEREHYDKILRDWGSQAAPTPAGEAARRVVQSLPPRRRLRVLWRHAAAGATVLLVALGLWLGLRQHGPRTLAVPRDTVVTEAQEGVVLMWLDPETPVYFVLSPIGLKKGDPS